MFASRSARYAFGAATVSGSISMFGGTAHAEQIRKFTDLEVKAVNQETPDVRRVTFKLPDSSAPLGFSPISAVMLKANIPGERGAGRSFI